MFYCLRPSALLLTVYFGETCFCEGRIVRPCHFYQAKA